MKFANKEQLQAVWRKTLTKMEDLREDIERKMPTKLSALDNDAGYMKESERQTVIDAALVQAKESGVFTGASSWNELTDKPFYATEEYILPVTQITQIGQGMPIFQPFELIEGETYTVNYNDVDYKSVARRINTDMVSGVALGNLAALGGENTGEPFVLGRCSPEFVIRLGCEGLVLSLEGLTSAVVSVTKEIVKKLDNKYLDLEWLPTSKGAEKTLYRNDKLEIATAGWHILTEANLFNLIERETYEVAFEGEKYQNVCKKRTGALGDIGTEEYYIGNLSLYNAAYENTGEPYCYWYSTVPSLDGRIYQCLLITRDYSDTTVSFAVIGPEIKYNPMPVKFMPEPVVFVLSTDMQTVTCNKTYAECRDLYHRNILNTILAGDIGEGLTKVPVLAYRAGDGMMVYTISFSGREAYVRYYADGHIEFQLNM